VKQKGISPCSVRDVLGVGEDAIAIEDDAKDIPPEENQDSFS